MNQPILYSFRRCPYAMRARLAIAQSSITVELREVILRDKPQGLLDISPKATVPVLLTTDNQLIDESIDIMLWSLKQSDPKQWITNLNDDQYADTMQLIKHNDGEFKDYLDHYKYADRYPEYSADYYRQRAEKTLQDLENNLSSHRYLIMDIPTLADMAILPFIRQFAFVDKPWFDAAPYPKIQSWLSDFIQSELFGTIMTKYPQWHDRELPSLFPSKI